jgi:predicted phage terminase large subunit-like protein
MSHEYSGAKRKLEREVARKALIDFTEYTFPGYQRNWHHESVGDALDKFVAHHDDYRRLIITMPPRRGKSELASRRLPAYILGRRPNAKIIASSYSDSLVTGFSRDAKRIIRSPAYQRLFGDTMIPDQHPSTRKAQGYKSAADHWEIVGHDGRYLGRGVDSSITGKGAEYIIADDLIKNRKEAQSSTIRDRVWDFLQDDLFTRLEFPGSVLVMMTRWHHDDPVGRLLDEDARDWKVINFPEVLTDKKADIQHHDDPRDVGDVLWPEWFQQPWEFCPSNGEGPEDIDETAQRDPEQVEMSTLHERGRRRFEAKKESNPRGAYALYQNNPTTDEGGFFEVEDFNRYHRRPSKMHVDEKLISVDCTFNDSSDSDYVVAQVWGRRGVNFYLLDQVRDRMGLSETVDSIIELDGKWPEAYRIVVEGKANGDAVLEILEDKLHGLYRFNPSASKEERAQVAAWEVGDGHVYVPDSNVCPWVNTFVRECKEFPNGSNDDQVDGFSQAMIYWTQSDSNDLEDHLDRILGYT